MQTRSCLVVLGTVFCLGLSPCAPGQRQFEEWLVKRYFPVDDGNTNALAVGDVDGDLDPDIVVGNAALGGGPGQQNRLYLNDGAGRFDDATAGRLPAHTLDTRALALGDVDGDLDLDLVVGNWASQQLYLNDGTGTFTDVTAQQLPVYYEITLAVAFADVDGDQDLDIVLGNVSQDRLYLNDGTGTFTDVTASQMPVNTVQTAAVALGDVDGDSDLDIVIGKARFFSRQQNLLYLNDGAGTFTDATASRMPVDEQDTNAVALGDVDGDQDLDIVFGNGLNPDGQDRLYLNDGTGTFVDATAARMPVVSDFTFGLALVDVDGDVDPDIVVANTWDQNRLYLNDGTGTFTDVTAQWMPADSDATSAVTVVDVDGDTDPDVVFANWPQNRLYLNDGASAFTDTSTGRLPQVNLSATSVALGDVDGDADVDIVMGSGSVSADQLYLNDGTGTFIDATNDEHIPLDSDPTQAVALGDVDGDLDLDLVLGNDRTAGGGRNRLYLNDGRGQFTDATAGRMPFGPRSTTALAMGDVDADGDLDLVFGNSRQRNRLFLNDGTGRFTNVTAAQMPVDSDETNAVALGDVDGDLDLDLVLGNLFGQNRLYLNDGTGMFTDVTATRLPVDSNSTRGVSLGDVDGDSDLDIVFVNWNQNRLYLNDGTGTFTDVTATRLPVLSEFTQAVALGDVDVDGDLDLVLGNGPSTVSGQNRLYLNDGAGTFVDATAARMPEQSDTTMAVALGDVDGDGDLDVVIGNTGRSRLYTNLHRQLSTPVFPILGRSYGIEFYAKPGYATSSHSAVAFLGFALLPAPLQLPPLGTFYVAPAVSLMPVSIPQATGSGVFPLAIPAATSLLGIELYLQALIVNQANPTGDVHLSGYTVDAIRQ